ncbi:MAG: DNA-binding protein [Reyranella sp.]|nr:DNA-binding protein [Reyranella sp.]
MAKTAPVPCIVRDVATDILAEDDSLAENVQRVPLHPLDQFRAFQALREKGRSEEDIAAAFFVSINVVRQRLRLASVSPKLLDLYAEDGMSLEQLMAFAVTNDHAWQEQVWEAVQHSYNQDPYQIRRMLTERAVRACDKRVRFVGVDAYEAAGGVVLRDLFEQDHGGWLEDLGLLDGLVAEKLKAGAQAIAGEGWKWIEVAVDFPYGHTHRMRKLKGAQADLLADERATIDALNAEYARLEAEYHDADELPDEVDQRLGEIEAELAAFGDRPVTYDPAEIAQAGAFISIDSDGRFSVDRGYVRPEDDRGNADGQGTEHADSGAPSAQSPCTTVDQGTVITFGHQSDVEAEDDDAIRPLPERLLMELTAHRTLALRNAVANNPHVAMTALLHKLCLDAFQHSTSPACLEASVGHVFFAVQASDLGDTAAAKAVAERHEAWKAELPTEEDVLWDWLAALDDDRRTQLLAHCVSFGVNALYERAGRYGTGLTDHGLRCRLAQADGLAAAVGLDMVAAGWRPTVENYLGRVTKPRILEAVREARGEQAAELIDHLKKGDMAKEAERLLDGTGWLPEPLRIATAAPDADEPSAQGEAFPEFLTSDDATADASEERPQQAAE